MPRLPEPKTTIETSHAFMSWCGDVLEYLKSFEDKLSERIAEDQLHKSFLPRILQGVAPEKERDQLANKNFYPLEVPKKDIIFLFSPLSNSEIEKISLQEHAYDLDGKSLQVKLNRSHVFIDREKDFSCHLGDEGASTYAKEIFLPDLSFPFLPYSRKFLDVQIMSEVTPIEKSRFLSDFSLDNLVLQGGHTARDLKMETGLIPYWNMLTKKENVGSGVSGMEGLFRWSIPPEEDKNADLRKGSPHIVHRALREDGTPAPITFRDPCFESQWEFKYIYYSIIREINTIPTDMFNYPVLGSQELNLKDSFWYRNFLQSAKLTQRDIDFFLNLLPEVKRGFYRSKPVFVENCSGERLKEMMGEKRKFNDYLWYLKSDELEEKTVLEEIKLMVIKLKASSIEDEMKFLLEDRINYFASICSLFLPMNFECIGYLQS
jgi:hypothetical protein